MTPHCGLSSERGMTSATARSRAALGLIWLYWLAFEHVLGVNASQVGSDLAAVVFFLKLTIPVVLLAVVPLRRSPMASRPFLGYAVASVMFIAWLSIPTLAGGSPIEIVKLLPRFVFGLAVFALFSESRAAFITFSKLWVVNTLVVLGASVLMYGTGGHLRPTAVADIPFAGPIPFFMNVGATVWVPTLGTSYVRLTGYFKEPSNASAVFFSAYFLSRYLASEAHARWRLAQLPCLFAGVASLSNAGFLAFGLALGVGVIQARPDVGWGRAVAARITVPVIAGALVAFAVLGRVLAQEVLGHNDWFRLATGLRQIDPTGDVTAGRLEIARNVLSSVVYSPLGVGLDNFVAGDNTHVSATAPLFWLYYGGLPALVLLIAREVQALRGGLRLRGDAGEMAVFQAFIVVLGQGLVYGTWMNPTYFIFAAAVLGLAYQRRAHSSRLV